MYYHHTRGQTRNDRAYEERQQRQYSWYSEDSPRRRSPLKEERHGCLQSGRISPNRSQAEQVDAKVMDRRKEKVKKPIQVDTLGIPMGTMKDQFTKDINAFVKEMNLA
jgi:hypothetical protein